MSGFVYRYLAQKPDIYRCICSHRDRLGFYADFFWNSSWYTIKTDVADIWRSPALSECWLGYCWHTWHRIFVGIFWQDSDSWCRYSWIVWNHAYMQLNLSTICSYMRIKRRSLDADMQQQFPYAAQNDFLTYKLGAAVSLYILCKVSKYGYPICFTFDRQVSKIRRGPPSKN